MEGVYARMPMLKATWSEKERVLNYLRVLRRLKTTVQQGCVISC